VSELDLVAAPGFVDPDVHAEFPGLRLCWTALDARPRASTRAVKQRLRALSNRYHGASVVAMRTQPIPHAYRAFFRQIGLDPDDTRIPSEEAAVGRLMHGGFRSTDLISDGLLVALIETGVPVWALDAEHVDEAGLGIRTTVEGEPFGLAAHPLPPGRLVVADSSRVHSLLFGAIAQGHGVTPQTRRITLFSVAVDGVPSIHIEEAVWMAVEMLTTR
jgi:DNA/RNA-binding domain of Phe-tRNA-synthetase-like protein